MKDGFYWIKREGCDLQVVEILEDEMYVCGSDVSGSLVEGKWRFFDDPIDIEYVQGPICQSKHG